MNKFVIMFDTFEIRGSFQNGLTADDLADYEANRSFSDPQIVETFDNLDAAREVFDKTYRQLPSTAVRDGWHGKYVNVEFYSLVEEKYDDEDDEAIEWTKNWDTAYEPLQAEEVTD